MEENQIHQEETRKEHILEMAQKIFMRYGLKSVTMDDISKELKISKKTLYRFVTDKNDLVAQVMNAYVQSDQCRVKEMIDRSGNAIEEIMAISEFAGSTVGQLHPSIHYDMEKYYPEAWEIFITYKRKFIFGCMTDNMLRGIKEGLYRADLNVPVISLIYVSRIDMVFDGQLFPTGEYQFKDVFYEMINYHLHGIVSEKGLKILNTKYKLK
jgi:AcrR family transcriptional regulator